jgi:hypothetical protein
MTMAKEKTSLENVAWADSDSPPAGYSRSGDIHRLVPASEFVGNNKVSSMEGFELSCFEREKKNGEGMWSRSVGVGSPV